MRRILILAPLLALLASVARAEPPSLKEAVTAFLLQEDPATRTHMALEILARRPEAIEVEAAVDGGWWWSEKTPKGEVTTWTRATDDGVHHTIYAYAPKAYTPKKAWPVLVWLHGLVNRPEDGGGESAIERFRARAEEDGFLILAPSARRGSEWWTPRGAKLVRESLMDLKRRWHVDADRVCAAGFSDGGSGCFHLLAHDPEPYCCFLSFMGNPLTTRIAGGPTWSTALTTRPVYAINGGQDRIFPSEELRPHYAALKEADCDIAWASEEDLGHDFAVLDRRWAEAHEFWRAHPRDANPKRVIWTTSRVPEEGRFAWLEIQELAKTTVADASVPVAVELKAPDFRRPRLGFRIDQAFEGPGLRVEDVEEDTPASEAGLEVGDVILKAGEAVIPSFREIAVLSAYLRGLGGAEGEFLVKRGEEELEVHAAPKLLEKDRPPRPDALGYGVAPGTVRGSVGEGNTIVLRTRGVRKLRLWLSRDLVDLDSDLRLQVDGKRVDAHPEPAAAVLLTQAIRGGPGAPRYAAYVDVTVP